MQEIQIKRQYHSKTFDNGDGTFTLKSHVGHIHYKDAQGDMVDSDFTPVDMGTYYEMSKHNYHLRVAKDFGAPLLMQYKNKYEGADHTITYEPFAIAWYNPTTDDLQIFRNQQSVQAVYDAEKNSFYYTNAFGNGVDFEITIQRSGFRKEVVIPNKPAQFPTAPGAGYKLVALFKYGGTGLKVLKDTQEEWDNSAFFEHIGNFELSEIANPVAKSFIRPAYGVDAEGRQTALRVAWKLRNNQLWQIKEIPLDKMQNATFPVRFDTVTSYYAGANDAAWDSDPPSSDWNTVHDATSAGFSSTGATGYLASSWYYSPTPRYIISRSYFPFDTSGIGSGNTVTAATIYTYLMWVFDDDNDGDDWMVAVPPTLATSGSPVAGDFDQIGAVNNPTEISSRVDITSMTSSAYNTFTLTDLSQVNVTGTTEIGFREGHDAIDSPIITSGNIKNRAQVNFSESTSNDPYIEVTYSAAAAASTPTPTLCLLGVG